MIEQGNWDFLCSVTGSSKEKKKKNVKDTFERNKTFPHIPPFFLHSFMIISGFLMHSLFLFFISQVVVQSFCRLVHASVMTHARIKRWNVHMAAFPVEIAKAF